MAFRTTSKLSAVARAILPVFLLVLVIAGLVTIWLRWDEWRSSLSVQSMDDAVVQADTARISARVSGNVSRVPVSDFQPVHAGDLLLEIDSADYDAAVAQAVATVAAARAAFDNLSNQKALQLAVVAQAEAQRISVSSRELETRLEEDRQRALVKNFNGTQ